MRRAPAVRGLEVVLAHQSAHPLLRGTNPHDPQARRLIVNAREAETVRSIFRWYCELGSVRPADALDSSSATCFGRPHDDSHRELTCSFR